METTVRKTVKEESAMDVAINRLIREGKPLSPAAEYWLTMDYNEGKILDMRAVLR